jgi:hypothetical protein
MPEVFPLVRHVAMDLPQQASRFLATLRASLLVLEGLLLDLELVLGTAVVAPIFDGISSREGGSSQSAQINPDHLIAVSQPGRESDLDGKDDVAVFAFSLKGARLNLALEGAMQFHLHGADLAEV